MREERAVLVDGFKRLAAARSLRGLGIAREDLHLLARHALNDACILTSPRPADEGELVSILEKAY